MSRIKRGVTTRAKHKRILEQAKGYRGRRKNTIRVPSSGGRRRPASMRAAIAR